MSWVDCHCHLTDPKIYSKIDQYLKNVIQQGITNFFIGGYSPSEAKFQLELKKKYSIITSIGLHPWYISSLTTKEIKENLITLESMLVQFDAVGETGVDGLKKNLEVGTQLQIFEKHIELASIYNKPMVLHIVREFPRAFPYLSKINTNFMVHSFSGGIKEAEKCLALGGYLSFSPRILNKKNYYSLFETVPIEKILIESDCPDGKPKNWKQSYNDPSSILLVAELIAKVKKMDRNEILNRVKTNLANFFSANET